MLLVLGRVSAENVIQSEEIAVLMYGSAATVNFAGLKIYGLIADGA